jgi:Peptidase A4 family
MESKLKWSTVCLLPLIAAVWALLGLTGPVSAGASSPPATVAVVLSASATPAYLPAAGGVVTVSGTVENAAICQLQLLSSQSFAVVFSHNVRACSSGAFSAKVTIGPNTTTVQRTVAFELVASNSATSSVGRFYVAMAGAKPASILSVDVTPAKLSAGGGVVAIAAKVENASTCQLQLLSKQSFPVVFSHNARACTSGAFSAMVTIGPNPTTVQRLIAFALLATGASHANDPLYVSLGSAQAKAAGGLPTTTNKPAVEASGPPAATQSSNWSGYSAAGGPFTAVKGTFTVPSVAPGTPGYDQVAEWVGVDGTGSTDTSLIQAGVDEYSDPQSPTGFDVEAWWEILPSAETDITNVSVKAGDSVTVTLWQVSSGTWEINLTDNTDGESYTTPPESYSGPGSSAEWIVEATTRCTIRCETAGLAPYSPAVAFSNLGMNGPETSLEEDTMLQQGVVVATPTALTSQGFSVAYSGPQLSGGE